VGLSCIKWTDLVDAGFQYTGQHGQPDYEVDHLSDYDIPANHFRIGRSYKRKLSATHLLTIILGNVQHYRLLLRSGRVAVLSRVLDILGYYCPSNRDHSL
jgi:hypothetical protein